jgi:hypothetical protein
LRITGVLGSPGMFVVIGLKLPLVSPEALRDPEPRARAHSARSVWLVALRTLRESETP